MSYLKLELAGYSVTLSKFANDEFPRTDPTNLTPIYTATGTTVVQGVMYEPPCLWTVNAFCSTAEYLHLKTIWTESDFQRRHGGSYQILVTDTTQEFVERYPRTRAIAPGTSEVLLPNASLPSHVAYFGQYKAWMPQQPKFQQVGVRKGVSFTLYEVDRVAA
jgi:hypothetical protein